MKGLKYVGHQSCCDCGTRELVHEYVNAMGRSFCYCENCTQEIEENEAIVETIKNDVIANNMEYQDYDNFLHFMVAIATDNDTRECYDYDFAEFRDQYETAFDELQADKIKRENNSLQVQEV